MASSRKRWTLTEDNLRRLQPSLIQPMAPVSISSDDDDDSNDGKKRKNIFEDPAVDAVIAREAPAARVARLRTWVYNAMLTLVGLGDEGAAVLAVDELYIAGPGDVRLRPAPHKRRSTRLKENNRGGVDGNEGQHEEEYDGDTPDLNDPSFWQAKLHYLEEKCRPLSQERRKRRRLAPESQIAAEDAARAEAEARAVEGRGPGCGYEYPAQMQQQQGARPLVGPAPTPALPEVLTEEQRQALEEARAERTRIEQSKLMWRDKRSRIQVWMETLPSPPSISSLSSSGSASNSGIPQIQVPPYGGLGGPAFDSRIHHYDQYGQQQQQQQQQHRAAARSDSSIVEITPAQFSNVQQQPQPPQEPTLLHQPATPHQQSQTFSTGHRHAGEGRPALHSSPHMPHNMAYIMNAPGPEYSSGHAAHSHHHLPHQHHQQQQQQYHQQHPQQYHAGAVAITHAMADASLDLSAVTPATAPHTAATPATLPIDTPITSASPGEGPVGDDMLAPSGAAGWPKPHKRDSHASLNASLNQSTSAVLGKRRRVGADGEVESGRA